MIDRNPLEDEANGNQRVLGELTNLYGKRPFPMDAGKLIDGAKSEITGGVAAKKEKKTRLLETVGGNGKGMAFQNEMLPGQHVILGSRGGAPHRSGKENVDLSRLQTKGNDHGGKRIREADLLKRSCVSTDSVPDQCDGSDDSSQEMDDGSQKDYEMDMSYFTRSAIQNQEVLSARKDSGSDFVDSKENKIMTCHIPTQVGCFGSSGLFDLKMSESKGSFDVHATTASSNVGDSTGSAEDCRCPFCLKAAYMWTDLHYQDTRGRLAALKKSRRQARSLEGKLYSNVQMAKAAPDNHKSAEMEFDLMQRCRSLFLHTEDALVCETTQLHSSLLRLKELMENCKRDLEMISDKS